MPLGEIGAFLLARVVVFIWGRFWLQQVDTLLHRKKRQIFSREEPPAWHPLPQEKDEDGHD